MGNAPIINGLFDKPTNTISYIVGDPATRKAAVIDPVLDYDRAAGTVDTRSVEALRHQHQRRQRAGPVRKAEIP
jgi:hypothetical protein